MTALNTIDMTAMKVEEQVAIELMDQPVSGFFSSLSDPEEEDFDELLDDDDLIDDLGDFEEDDDF